MAAHPSHSFASPDLPGDACVILVLLESTPNMSGYWPELQSYYLPLILQALQNGTPDTPIHVYWQMTADPDNFQPMYSNSYTNLPDAPFDVAAPLSLAALCRAVDTVRAVELVGRATRHLLVIAANAPQDPAQFLASGGHSPDSVATRDALMTTLCQERIRMHMVLAASPRLQALRDFHSQLLCAQISVEVPAWFQVDSRRFTVHLAAKPAASEGGDEGPLPTHGASSAVPRSGPVTPTSTAAALPYASHSPPDVSPQGQPVASSSPTRRTTRNKGKEAAVPMMDQQGPGLVNYLKQVHGLTKRKAAAGKGGKRAAASEPSRGSRPILPRLELPVAGLAVPLGTERSPTKPAQVAAGAGAPGPPPQQTGTAVQSQVPNVTMVRSWPWIQPVPVTPSATVPNLSPTASAALRNLARLAPRAPPPGGPGQRASNQVHASPYAEAHVGSSPSPVATMAPPRHQGSYPGYGLGSSPSPPQQFHSSSSPPSYHQPGAASYHPADVSSPTYGAPHGHDVAHTSAYANAAYYGGQYPYAISPHNSDHSNSSPPLPSPAASGVPAAGVHVGHGTHGGEDPENQPFIVTPEYEALANARFAAAMSSGAVQASMTPSALSPAAASPAHANAGYFASVPAPPHPAMAPAPPGYAYHAAGQHDSSGFVHDSVHFASRPGGMADPAHHTTYY